MTTQNPWEGGDLAAALRRAQNGLMAETIDPETIRDLASQAYKAMERATRDDGTEYTRKRDDAPEWVGTIVYDAHGGLFLPDDWRYECIREAFAHVADSTGHTEDLEETVHEFADAADVYNDDLLRWVGSNQNRAGYVDEARAEFGEPRDFYHSLQMGQYQERAEVYTLVLSGLRKAAELQVVTE